ncbi:hypothetical protein [Kaarinaea lacus]
MKTITGFMITLAIVICQNNSFAAFGYDPTLTWKTLRTEHFLIHYHDDEEQLAQNVAQISERAHQRISKFFNWQPEEPTQIVLVDRMDFSNAFAYPMPHNTMQIIVTPPDDYDTISDYHNWLDLVINHEYVHIIHVDKVAGLAQGGRNIFGRHTLFFPNALQPTWVLEGIATYHETQLAPGIGRGQNSAFRSFMRLEVASGIKPLSQVNQPIVSWPAGNTRYLYGVYFFNFLMETYGESQVKDWIQNYSNNLIPYLMNTTSKKVFEKNVAAMWAEFENYLSKQFIPEIESIKQSGPATGKQLTQYGYTTGPPRSLPNGDILFVKQDWLSEPELMLLPFGESVAKQIAEVHGSRIDVHPDAGVLVAQIDLVDSVNYFADLHHIDIKTGKRTQLTHGKRYKHAAWSPDGKNIIAVQTILGNSALHLLTAKGEFVKTLWQSRNKEIVSELDWSPDATSIVASVWRPQTHWNIEVFNINDQSWQALTQTRGIEYQPQYIQNGKAILYSADYSGVFNIYQLELASTEVRQLTNVMGAAVSATESPDDQGIFYLGQHANGTDIFFLAKDETLNQQLALNDLPRPYPPMPEQENKFSNADSKPYFALDKIAPTGWFPYLSLTNERNELGISVSGSDPLNWHQYALTAAYDFSNNWPLGWFSYRYDRWRVALKLSFQREVLTVLDTQGNLNSFRDSDTLTAEALLPFLTRDRQWTYHFGISSNKESDKEVEPTGIPLATLKDEILGAALTYNSARHFPRGISLEDGVRLRAVAEDSDTLDSDYTGQVYTLDWTGYFSLTHKHVLTTRLIGGLGTQTPNPFRLGGSGKDFAIVPPAATLYEPTTDVFNKRQYPLRGYPEGLANLVGPDMLLANIEWRFPLALVESGIMVPPVGIYQLHGTLFYSAGDAWDSEIESADYSNSAGLEFYMKLILGYFIPLDIRLGYAHGFDENGEDQVYLDALFSF